MYRQPLAYVNTNSDKSPDPCRAEKASLKHNVRGKFQIGRGGTIELAHSCACGKTSVMLATNMHRFHELSCVH